MVPVRSEPIHPELPLVSPIRLQPWEAIDPRTSGPLAIVVFFATMVLPRVTVPLTLSRPPPSLPAVLPLTVQLVSVVVEPLEYRPPPSPPYVYRPWYPNLTPTKAVLPLTVQLVSVVVPP